MRSKTPVGIRAAWIAILGVVILAIVTLAVPFIEDRLRGGDRRELQYIGRVIDSKTRQPVAGAKVSLDLKGVPPVVYTDSEGVYRFELSIDLEENGTIRIDAQGYEPYIRLITLLPDNERIEDIRLTPQNENPTQMPSVPPAASETATHFGEPDTPTSTQVSPGISGPENLDFETIGEWIFSPANKYWGGQYSSDWSSSGQKSYQIYILTDPVGSIYPGENTYAEIYQNIDLSGASELLFDLKTYGNWNASDLNTDSFLSLEVWIDDRMVFSHERQGGIYNDQTVPLSGFTGIHRLAIRLKIHANYNASPPGLGMYVDNLRFVRAGTAKPDQNNISNFKIMVVGENYLQVQVDYTYIGSRGSEDVFLGVTGVLTDGSTMWGLGYTPEQITVGSGTKTVTMWLDSIEPGTYNIGAFEACFHIAGQYSFYCKKFPYTMVLNR